MKLLLPLLLLLLVIAVPAPAATTTRLGSLPNESFIRVEGEHRLVSVRDGDNHRLALFRDGRAQPLPIQPSRHALQADIGTDRDGAITVILSRCEDERGRRCDLFLHRLGTPGERPVRGANTLAAERAPTISRGRIAWVRGTNVYTRLLASRLGSHSRRLAGVPKRRCDYGYLPTHSCRLKARAVEDLELRGDRLALDVSYIAEGGSGHYQREIRLADLRGGSRRIASGGTGEGGQDFLGLSFTSRHLGWVQVCYGDPCGGRAHRYHLGTGGYQIASAPALAGFSLTANGFIGIDGRRELGAEDAEYECDDFDTRTPAAPACPVIQVEGAGWRSASARRVRD